MTITRDVEGQVNLTLVKPETLVKHCKANTKHIKVLFSLSELPLSIQSKQPKKITPEYFPISHVVNLANSVTSCFSEWSQSMLLDTL